MILIHGSGSDSRYLADIANAIANKNIATVITPDMRGHGRNTGKRGDIDFIGQLEKDIEDFNLVRKISILIISFLLVTLQVVGLC